MGLLERALQYKQKINDTGKTTLIDRIKGPAETEKSLTVEKIDIIELDHTEEPLLHLNSDLLEEINSIEERDISVPETHQEEEEILLFDESSFDSADSIHDNFKVQESAISPITEFSESEIELGKNYVEYVEDIEKSDIKHVQKSDTPETEIDESAKIHDGNDFEIPEFNDYGTLFEIQKEFIKADTVEEVYSTILFSIMGQLGVSSVSIVAPSVDDEAKWVITDTHGIKISDSDIHWVISEGILEILSTYKGVLDIEDIKNDNNLRDDYYKFTSVDARILTPLVKNDKLAGVILVGEKINSEDFTDMEIEFLQALSDISSSILESLYKYEKTSTELFALRIEKEILSDVELFQDSILNVTSLGDLEEVIQKNFYSLGLECYTLFVRNQVDGDYYPAYNESGNILGFSDSGFKIKKDNRLVSFLISKKSSIILENFNESNVIIDTFGRNRIVKMELFIAYPFIISGQLSGFITIFKINPAVDIVDIDIRIQKINRFLFPYLHRMYEIDPELNRSSDLISMFYEKIENEMQHARDLNIPMSLVMFSVKNYKRFYERFGRIELEKLYMRIAEIIKSRLNHGDFSARIDRSKFLVVLPGKEKKYSMMLANTIKNEVIEKHSSSDFKLLITSLNSVFPEDGKDLFTILEVLE
jgi:GGDEF domain-containing protein